MVARVGGQARQRAGSAAAGRSGRVRTAVEVHLLEGAHLALRRRLGLVLLDVLGEQPLDDLGIVGARVGIDGRDALNGLRAAEARLDDALDQM